MTPHITVRVFLNTRLPALVSLLPRRAFRSRRLVYTAPSGLEYDFHAAAAAWDASVRNERTNTWGVWLITGDLQFAENKTMRRVVPAYTLSEA